MLNRRAQALRHGLDQPLKAKRGACATKTSFLTIDLNKSIAFF